LPDAAIGTDVIAGFPGETNLEFDRTRELLEELPFTYFHVFPYSKRSGTTAAKLSDHIAPARIRQRAKELRRLGERKRAAFAASFVGRTLPVLIEEGSGRSDLVSGYARNYQRVEVRGAAALTNREVLVEIRGARGAILAGEPAS